jgi:NDP-sugar pyrophosphorylase family protein
MPGLSYAIAMAGLGSRFSAAGYKRPKYMIEAGGRTLFEHSVFSLPLELAEKIYFIALREHEEKFGLSSFIDARLGCAMRGRRELVLLDAPTRGQAETVLRLRGLVPEDGALGIYNIDTCFRSATLACRLSDARPGVDGVIGSFRLEAQDPKWSFARTGPGGVVTETAEKVQISGNALTGFYHFRRAGDFFGAAAEAVASGSVTRGEFYVAPLYNTLIAAGRRFVLDEADEFVPLGTPEDVAAFGAGRKG